MKEVYGDRKLQYMLCILGKNLKVSMFIQRMTHLMFLFLLVNLLSFIYGTFGLEYGYNFRDEDNQEIILTGCIAGTPLFGFLVDKIGRKKALISVGLFFFLAEMFIGEPNVEPVGRFLIGLGCAGLYITIPIYICEIAQYRIRGRLGSCLPWSISLGCIFRDFIHLITEVETTSLKTYDILRTTRIMSFILFLAVSYWIPETPVVYIVNNKMEKASNVLMKLRGNNVQIAKEELEDLVSSIGTLNENKKRNPFRNFITDPGTKKVLVIGFFLFTAMQLNYEFIGYGPKELYFFKGKFETMVIFTGLFHILSLTIGSLLIERCGRRFLLLVSSGTMIMNGVFYYLYFSQIAFLDVSDDSIWDLVSPSLSAKDIAFTLAYNIGFRTLPWVLLPEILKTDVRSAGISSCNFLFWIESFLLCRYRYLSLDKYTFAFRSVETVFLMFCWICTYYYVPETKGESLEIIPMQLIRENRPRIV